MHGPVSLVTHLLSSDAVQGPGELGGHLKGRVELGTQNQLGKRPSSNRPPVSLLHVVAR